MKNIKADILWRVFLVYLGMLLFGLAIIVKVVFIQVKEGPELLAKADSLTIRYFNVEASRGNVCADDGSLLATSIPIFDIRMDVASPLIDDNDFNNHIGELATKLSALFGNKTAWEYKSELQKARRKGNRYFLVKSNVTYEQLKALRDFPIFDRGKYKGGMIIIPKQKKSKNLW
ncbi:MAG: hypothetical protein R2759_04160 [Bacteroidales bacterium]